MFTPVNNPEKFRKQVLSSYGATDEEIAELLIYNQNVFKHSHLNYPIELPLAPEAYVSDWIKDLAIAQEVGIFEVLKRKLIQLRFPVREGISQTNVYRQATHLGLATDGMKEMTGLILQQPEKLQLRIHPSFAGAIPVVQTPHREDFVSLVQALALKNEPKGVPASMGACLLGQRRLGSGTCSRQHHQEHLILLCEGFYSNVPATAMGLSASQWRCLSLIIRLEHECTHYFTHRLFGSKRNHIFDELMADYRGIVAATGIYRADWFLRFLGLESFPHYREGGRLQNYQSRPPLSDGAFEVLKALLKAAAENLQHFDREQIVIDSHIDRHFLRLISLSYLTLEELASEQANDRLQLTLARLQTNFNIRA